jgi:CBS domain containing-hemolysin-like protein
VIGLAVTVLVILAVVIGLVAVIESNTAQQLEEASHRHEALSFLRNSLTAIFGVVMGQVLAPVGYSWWFTSVIALVITAALLVASQLVARWVGGTAFGRWLTGASEGLIRSWALLFTPLALPKAQAQEEFEQELHESVEEFGETLAREIMVPRIDMVTVGGDVLLPEALSEFLAGGYSRLPVTDKSIDDVVGILYLKDVVGRLHVDQAKASKLKAKSLARPAIYVPDSLEVDDLLRQLKLAATHIAIVVDEYGGVAGLVTLEDVIEELVGEISDEYDREAPELTKLEDGSWRVNARFSLFDLGEEFGIELADEDVDSVGGIVAKLLGRLPKRGDSVEYSGLRFTAERIEGRRKRLVSVLVESIAPLEDTQAAFGGEK